MKNILRYTFVLLFICLLAASLLAAVNKVTKPKIESQRQKQLKMSLKIVMPQASEFKKAVIGKQEYFKALDERGNLIGYCFKIQAQGYSSTIEIMVGLKEEGIITGIHILSQNETPGLGSKIVEVEEEKTLLDISKRRPKLTSQKPEARSQKKKPWFQEQFRDKKISDLNLESIDAITGATISSMAVIDSVRERALKFLKEIKDAQHR